MFTFRLATLNIHQFRHSESNEDNLAELVSLLKPLELDLLAVQEISDLHRWRRLCEQLDLHNYVHGSCDNGFLANGIATRHPIASSSNQSDNVSCRGESRAMLQCRLGGDHPFGRDRLFAVTHLDHMNEDVRVAQMHYFQPQTANVDVLLGDMNALTRDDYTGAYFQRAVVDKRKNSSWEKPRFELTQLITEQWNYRDAFRRANPGAKDAEVVTCKFDTRIDYIFLRPREDDRWKLSRCSIIDTQPATDHHAVLAEFTLSANSKGRK